MPESQPGLTAGLVGFDTQPGRNGGTLRRGNGGRGGRKSAVAAEILEAATPEAARLLAMAALEGQLPAPGSRRGNKARRDEALKVRDLSHPDRLKAMDMLLSRGKVVAPRAADSGADAPGLGVSVVRGGPVPPAPPAAEPGSAGGDSGAEHSGRPEAGGAGAEGQGEGGGQGGGGTPAP